MVGLLTFLDSEKSKNFSRTGNNNRGSLKVGLKFTFTRVKHELNTHLFTRKVYSIDSKPDESFLYEIILFEGNTYKHY